MANSQYFQSKLCVYPEKGKSEALAAIAGNQLGVFNARAVNNSGGVANIGIGRTQTALDLLTVTTAGPTYTSQPSPSVGSPVEVFSGAADQGMVVGSSSPLNLIGFTVSTAQAGGTYEIQQFDGSAWVAKTVVYEAPADYGSNGDKYHVAALDTPLAQGGDDVLLESHKYYTRIIATAGAGGPVEISDLWAQSFLEFREGVANNAQLSVKFDWRQPFLLEAGEGLAPYFSVAGANNQFGTFYTLQG